MVFILRNIETGDIYVLGHNMEYTIGRSRKNHIILRCGAVDNLHATLKISRDEATIEDLVTKCGTSVNRRIIRKPSKLLNGDVVLFGRSASCKYVFLDATFEVQLDKQIPERTRTSLTKTLKCLNFKIVESYRTFSTHYVTEKVTLDTLKEQSIFKYLIDKKTVITPKYFEDLFANIKEAPLLPNLYRYVPEIDEFLLYKGIEDIPRISRRSLFEDVLCIFFNEACEEKLCPIILKCGGDTITYTQDEKFLERINYVVKMFIAVNHNSDGKKTPLMKAFSRTLREHKMHVYGTFRVMDIYKAIIKATLNKSEIRLENNNDSSRDNPGDNPNHDSAPINLRKSNEQHNNSSKSAAKHIFKRTGDGWITGKKINNCRNTSVTGTDTEESIQNPQNAYYNSSSREDIGETSGKGRKRELVIIIDDDDDGKEPISKNSTIQSPGSSRKKSELRESDPSYNKRRCLVINPFSSEGIHQRKSY